MARIRHRRAVATLACVGVLLLLAACAGQSTRAPAPALAPKAQAQATQRQVERETWLQAHPDWTLQGRVAVANARDGGSGRIDWQQAGTRFDVTLTAPVTRQGWRLSGDAAGAVLDGLDGGPREGDDASALLLQATGWEIPVTALSAWVRGARAEVPRHGPATVAFAADGQLAQLQQDGWTIDYTGWQPAAESGAPALPLRLQARRGDAKVRLVIDRWGAVAP